MRINGHKLHFSVAEDQRLSPFSVDTIEDEYRVPFVCSFYSQLRGMFRLTLYRGLPRKEHYYRLCSDSDGNTLLRVSKFIFFVLTRSDSLTD